MEPDGNRNARIWHDFCLLLERMYKVARTRVNQWRQQNGIPKEVFISVMGNFNHSTNINDVENPEALKKHGKDDYKPQYISFENPILVDLFNKLLSKVSEQLQIEEMLPGRKHLTEINGSHYVKEYKIQWFY